MQFDTAAYLIGAGANPNQWDLWGRAPLYAAVDVNTIPRGGRPDLPSLDETSSLDVIRLLLDAGANPNARLRLPPPFRNVGNDRGLDGMLTTGTTPLLRAAKALDAPAIQSAAREERRSDAHQQPRHDADDGGGRTGVGGCRHARLLPERRHAAAIDRRR